MSGSDDMRLDRLAEEFVARRRDGSHPSITEYARRYPELADDIHEVFPVLTAMEDLRGGHAALESNAVLGDYRLVREIGRGGMGVVYEAVQTNLGRRVALKVLPTSATLDPRYLERFQVESRAAARLSHPNIVPVIGAGEHDGVHYYTMQYVEGRGLDVLVRELRALEQEGPADAEPRDATEVLARRLLLQDLGDASGSGPDESGALRASAVPTSLAGVPIGAGQRYHQNVARLLLQAAEGVAAAHAHGVLHRDLKPSNLLVDEHARVWITDFGLCKEEGSDDLTEPGDMLGTLRYLPPERIEGESDARGDVYGLGITLYELLTRSSAYAGGERMSLLRRIAEEGPRRPRAVDARIPRDLEVICLKAIEREPARRYATAEALAADLRAFLEGREVSARPPSLAYTLRVASRRHRALALTLVVAVVALVTSSLYYLGNLRAERTAGRFQQYVASLAAADAALRTGDAATARSVLQAAPDEHRNWEWHQLASRLDRSVRTVWSPAVPTEVEDLAYSPDGSTLAIAAGDETVLIDHTTRAELARLSHGGRTQQVAWSPDGARIAIATSGGVESWSWPGAERLWHWQPAIATNLVYAHDGRAVYAATQEGLLVTLDPERGEERAALVLHDRPHGIALDPTGQRLAVSAWGGEVTVWDLRSRERVWSRRVSPLGAREVTFVGEDLVACATERPHTTLLDAETGEPLHTLSSYKQSATNLVVSTRDNRRLLVSAGVLVQVWDTRSWELVATWREEDGLMSIEAHPSGTRCVTGSPRGVVREWLLEPLGNPDVLRGHADDVADVALAPSGAFLASGGIGGVVRLWDGHTGEQTRTWIGHRWTVNAVAIAPDEGTVASADALGEIVLWDVVTDAPRRRLVHGELSVRGLEYLPDGRLVSTGRGGRLRVWSAAGDALADLQVSPSPLGALAIDRRGRWIVTGSGDGGVRFFDAETLEPGPEPSGHADEVTGLAFDSSGRRLASVSQDQTLRLWDVASGEELYVTRAQDETAYALHLLCVGFHPDGDRIVTGGRDGQVRLWEAENGRPVGTVENLYSWVYTVLFAPEGDRLIACSGAPEIRFWDTRSIAERFGTRPLGEEPYRRALELVDARWEPGFTPAEVAGILRGDDALDPELREAALRIVHRRLGSEQGLVDHLWRVVTQSPADPLQLEVARGLAAGLVRASGHRNRQDTRRQTLRAAATSRSGEHELAIERGQEAARFNQTRFPELYAVDLSFLTLSHAALGHADEARETLERLDAHLAAEPSAETDRARDFREEARAAVAGLSGPE